MDLLSALPRRAACMVAVVALAIAATTSGASAQTLTQDEALRLVFADADSVDRRTAYLDDAQLRRATQFAGPDASVEAGVVTYYVAVKGGQRTAVAYFDAHRVRTLPEVLMVVVGRDARIRRIEVVRFAEPPEYRPPPGWLGQFHGRRLDDALTLKGDIAPITGATLTARAAATAARRVLALHKVIAPLGEVIP